MVYFAQYRTGHIKIGHSKDPAKRVKAIGSYFIGHGPAKLLGAVPGNVVSERIVLERWQGIRVPGFRRASIRAEVFCPKPELLDWIDRAIAAGTIDPPPRKYDPVWLFEPD